MNYQICPYYINKIINEKTNYSLPVYLILKTSKQKSFQLKSVSENRNWFFVNLFTLYQDEMKQLAKSVRMAIYVTNTANIVLFAAKVFASIESKSLAVIASILAPLFDLLWEFILWFTSHAMQNPNQHQYPIGKKRMQPVVSHPTQQLWGCIWKHLNVYLNLSLSLHAISLIGFMLPFFSFHFQQSFLWSMR